MLYNCECFICHLLIFFFKINIFSKIASECQRYGSRLGMIWVQSVGKGDQQTRKVATSGKRVNQALKYLKIGTCPASQKLLACMGKMIIYLGNHPNFHLACNLRHS